MTQGRLWMIRQYAVSVWKWHQADTMLSVVVDAYDAYHARIKVRDMMDDWVEELGCARRYVMIHAKHLASG